LQRRCTSDGSVARQEGRQRKQSFTLSSVEAKEKKSIDVILKFLGASRSTFQIQTPFFPA
jgi:hypothetical protein